MIEYPYSKVFMFNNKNSQATVFFNPLAQDSNPSGGQCIPFGHHKRLTCVFE